MAEIFTQAQGWFLLAIFAAFSLSLAVLATKAGVSKSGFLVAGRDLAALPAGLSIAATWIWAPALFIAAQQAYMNGVAGLFWFTVPNVACLIIFAFFAERVRQRMPGGFTLSDFMRETYSARVQGAYLFQLTALSVCAFAVQLLAGGAVVSALTGIPLALVTLALAGTAISYSLWSGLRASVLTDWLQILLILAVALTLIPWAVSAGGGWATVAAGSAGINQRLGVFDADVALGFGIAVTIGLLSGPFGDQSFWQRTFAIRPGQVRRAFFIGAAVFAVVPLTLSLPGFLAVGAGLEISSPQLVNVEAVLHFLPAWVAVPLVFMLLAGLVSTLDSCLCAVSSLAAHDGAQRWRPAGDPMAIARWAMLTLAGLGVALANVPGLQILYLFLFYGTLRAATLLPTVLTILGVRLDERGVFCGIVTAICVGLPIFAYGNFGGGTAWVVAGSLTTVLSSGAVALAMRSPAQARRAGAAL